MHSASKKAAINKVLGSKMIQTWQMRRQSWKGKFSTFRSSSSLFPWFHLTCQCLGRTWWLPLGTFRHFSRIHQILDILILFHLCWTRLQLASSICIRFANSFWGFTLCIGWYLRCFLLWLLGLRRLLLGFGGSFWCPTATLFWFCWLRGVHGIILGFASWFWSNISWLSTVFHSMIFIFWFNLRTIFRFAIRFTTRFQICSFGFAWGSPSTPSNQVFNLSALEKWLIQ